MGRLAELSQDKYPDPDEVVAIVRTDPAFAGAVLRLANSAEAAPRHGVSNVYRAVVQVGGRAAVGAALRVGFEGMLPVRLPGYGTPRSSFAEHSVRVGSLTASAVRLAFLDLIGDPFVAGLLHDCGKLVLGPAVAKRREAIERSVAAGLSWEEAEQEHVRIDHAAAGATVITKWKLPPLLRVAAQFHHAPEKAETHVDRRLCAAVQLADQLVHGDTPCAKACM